jgi:hypothetical protein
MPLIVGNNSYVSVAEADAYMSTRIDNDAWANAAAIDREKALVTATGIVDQYQFIGIVSDELQSLAWPRGFAVFYDPFLGYNSALDSSVVPNRIKVSVFEQALHLLLNENLLDDTDESFERIKIGPLEIEDKSEFKAAKVSGIVLRSLRPLLSKSDNGATGLWWRSN